MVVHDVTAVRQWLNGLLNPASCYVLIRHSHPFPGGSNETRTLTEHGVQLCRRVRRDYQDLAHYLAEKFGEPVFQHSGFPRTFATGLEIFYPEEFSELLLLTLRVSLKAIQGGKWLEEQKADGRSLAEMLTAVHRHPELVADQPYDDAMDRMDFFFRQSQSAPHHFFIGIGHEPEPSLWLLKHGLIPEEEVGRRECQAYILVRDQRDTVPGVVKFAPEATEK